MFIDELFAQIIKEPIVTKSRIAVSHEYVCTREKWKSKIRGDVGVCGGERCRDRDLKRFSAGLETNLHGFRG